MIRIAAVGDVHYTTESGGKLRPHLDDVDEQADVLLVAGDLTALGDPREAAVLARDLRTVPVPIVAVLGNHDYHLDGQVEIRRHLESAGVRVLEGDAHVVAVDGTRLGIAGVKGFGGGFAGACATEFGEPEFKAFVRHTREVADRLAGALSSLEADARVALLHYSPVEATLRGERPEIYPFLGSYLLGEAVDSAGAHLVLHGHAHRGTEKGVTPGGVHVRNVAQPVIKHAFNLYRLDERRELSA